MITASALNSKSVKDLGILASRYGVDRWRSLGRVSLIKAIVRATQSKLNQRQSKSSKAIVKNGKHVKVAAKTKLKPATAKATVKATVAKVENSKVEKSRSIHGAHEINGRTSPPTKLKAKTTSPRIQARIESARAEREQHKNLATRAHSHNDVKILNINGNGNNGHGAKQELHKSSVRKDRVVLLVRDAYWLQAVWEMTRQSVERAQVALAQQWHTAKPVLRLIRLESNNTTSAVEQVAREITIHGGVNTWFLDVVDSPKSFRVDIGYVTASGKFFSLARSNSVTTPRPGSGDGLENNWSDIASDCEKIYALSGGFSDEPTTGELQEAFEERLGRPMGASSGRRYGVGADKVFMRRTDFQFDVDAEMIIFGRTRSNARVTLAGNPVKLRPDGTFAARLAMPDRRQVLPIVASSADGVEQQTVVIAVERNTKVMEPMVRESSD